MTILSHFLTLQNYYTIKRMALHITLVIYSIFPFFIIIMYLLYLSKFHITACAFSKSFLATKISYCMDCDIGFPTLPKFPRSVPDPAHSPFSQFPILLNWIYPPLLQHTEASFNLLINFLYFITIS